MEKFNEVNLMRAIHLHPEYAFRLAQDLGIAINAINVYESVKTRPGQNLDPESKLRIVDAKAKSIIGIINDLQKKTGTRILKGYISEDKRNEFVQDLDDFFNELYCEKQQKLNPKKEIKK